MTELETEKFSVAVEKGEIVNKSGYHQPHSHRNACTACTKTTKKGAYRDVSVKMPDGRVIHYYHQSPIVVEKDGQYRLDSHGYHTSTTKERINGYLPRGYSVKQKDFDWYINTEEIPRYKMSEVELEDFHDGMVIEQ